MNDYSKIEAAQNLINAARPFEGDTLRQLRDYYRIGLTWSSNAIEGNTLSISETKVILEDGITVGGKPLRDTLEAVGHGEAYDYMFSLINTKSITVCDIKRLHELFYRSIDTDNAGKWRSTSVIVTGTDYVFSAPQEIESEMNNLAEWINTARESMHPVEFAAMLHLKLVSVHPFTDGNGRTARLVMNLSLLQSGYQLAIIPPVCRAEYNDCIRQYQRGGNAAPFCDFIAQRVYETQKELIRLLHLNAGC